MNPRPDMRPLLAVLILCASAGAAAVEDRDAPATGAGDALSGLELMERVRSRHQLFPWVYEEVAMVLVDPDGRKRTRQLRRYSRLEEDGTLRWLLVFDTPSTVAGVALLAERAADGTESRWFYLPALGDRMVRSADSGDGARFLGTDFSVSDLVGERLEDHRYERQRDTLIEGVPHYVVDVFPAGADPGAVEPRRRHFVQQDIEYITRTDIFDDTGRISRRQTSHDLQQVDRDLWRPGMILMEDLQRGYSTLLRIQRRIFSRDYVPATVFEPEYLFSQAPARREPEPADDAEPADGVESEQAMPVAALVEEEAP